MPKIKFIRKDTKFKPKKQTQENIVEKIVSKHNAGGIDFYEIKWLGFSNAHNTYEPIEHLNEKPAVQFMVREFNEKYDKKQEKKLEKLKYDEYKLNSSLNMKFDSDHFEYR